MTRNAILISLVIVIAGAAVVFGLVSRNNNIKMEENNTITATSDSPNPTALVETSQGNFELELFAKQMPITAGNFIKLAEAGFYDGTRFHRVIAGFMIQGGDPLTKSDPTNQTIHGTGGPGYFIPDEFVTGTELSNKMGTIAMANSGPNSGGSQFFINVGDNSYLDFDKEPLSSRHPVFGRIINGQEVVLAISGQATGPGDQPIEPIIINKVTINK